MGDGCHLMFNLSLLHVLTPNTFNMSFELDYYDYTVYSYVAFFFFNYTSCVCKSYNILCFETALNL